MMNTQLEKLDQTDQPDELHQSQLSEETTDSDDSIQEDDSKRKQTSIFSKFIVRICFTSIFNIYSFIFLDRKIAIDALESNAKFALESQDNSKTTNNIKRTIPIITKAVPITTEVIKKEFVAKVKRANVLFSK